MKFTILVGILFVATLGLLVQQQQKILKLKSQRIIRFDELQQQLTDRGYPVKVDNEIGKQTLFYWEKAICQDYANIYINRKTMGLER